MSFPDDVFGEFGDNSYQSPHANFPAIMFSQVPYVYPDQTPSHNAEDVDQISLCILRSFPHYGGDATGARAALRRFLSTLAFRDNSMTEDAQLQSPLFLRKRGEGFQCRWCLKGYSRSKQDAAVDCMRGHIGHRPYECLDRCPLDNQGCHERFTSKAALRGHQRKRRRGA